VKPVDFTRSNSRRDLIVSKKQKLELTWIGKENRPRLEPRILLEDPEKSYHAKYRVKAGKPLTAENAKNTENSDSLRSLRSLRLNEPGDLFDNRLIFGDNLLALKAIEQEFAGQINEARRHRAHWRRHSLETRQNLP
jgi:adenine-specific DNA-methyltransferase